MTTHLFLYGTLMSRSGRVHPLLAGAVELLGEAHVAGELYDVGPWPALRIESAITSRVWGELYRLLPRSAEVLLTRLDHHEGADLPRGECLYERIQVEAARDDTPAVPAWTYRYARSLEEATRISSGSYRVRS